MVRITTFFWKEYVVILRRSAVREIAKASPQ
jgi:hypothetical protein